MPTRVVAISHTGGAGGEDVGRIVADRLRFRYVDEGIILTAAQKEGIEPSQLADEERRKGLLERLVDRVGKAGMAAGSIGFTIPDVMSGSDDFRVLIREAIDETAALGDVVIVSHAASIALAGKGDLLRVLITASPTTRVHRLAHAGDVREAEAEKLVKRSDAARADYLSRFYAIDQELPTHYDLVLNTDLWKPEEAAEIVIRAAALSPAAS